MKDADDRAVAKQVKREAAAQAAKEKSTSIITKAAQSANSSTCSHGFFTGDAKKGANLFKVSGSNTGSESQLIYS
jgi:hypothetical protein